MNMVKCPQCEMENPETEEFCSECGTKLGPDKTTPAPAARPAVIETLALGSTFSEQYKVVDYLGRSGMGKVYKVYDLARERELALRLFSPDLVKERKAWAHFAGQLDAVRGIVHKNVARLFDLREEKGTPYVTMEYVSGQDLRTYLRKTRRLNAEKITALARQLCFGLAEIHRAGILHLDLKPSNIIIDKEASLKITDAGLGLSFSPRGNTDSGIAVGIKEYLSPEQLRGQEFDQRTDIYSLGVALYEMATGEVPFKGDQPADISPQQEPETARNPRDLNPLVSEELGASILKCLEREKDNRYQTAEELRLEIEKIGEGKTPEPVEPAVPLVQRTRPTPEKPRPLRKPDLRISRRKFLVPGLAGAVFVLVGLLLWRLFFLPPKAPAPLGGETDLPTLAILPFEDLDPAKKASYLGTGLAETLGEALAGVRGLRVLSACSLFSLDGRIAPSQAAGKIPGVDYRITGELRVSGESIHLTARLIDQKTEATAWFKEKELNWGTLSAGIAGIADEIGPALHLPESEAEKPIIRILTADREAAYLYWQGKELWNKGGKESLEKSIEYFQKAAAKDASCALAQTGLGYAYAALCINRFWPPNKAFPKAKIAALEALQADTKLSEAHTLLAFLRSDYDWDRSGAETEHREAIRLKPGNAAAHQKYALFLSSLGRHEEAIKEIELARSLHPISRGIRTDAVAVLYFARRYNQALDELRLPAAGAPEDGWSHYYAGLVNVQTRQFEAALASFRRASELGADAMEASLCSAYVYGLQGRRSEVGRLLTEALQTAKKGYVPSVAIAAVYAGVGERDQAVACLEKALAERELELAFLKVHPLFDSVRGDPRFSDILKRIGLE